MRRGPVERRLEPLPGRLVLAGFGRRRRRAGRWRRGASARGGAVERFDRLRDVADVDGQTQAGRPLPEPLRCRPGHQAAADELVHRFGDAEAAAPAVSPRWHAPCRRRTRLSSASGKVSTAYARMRTRVRPATCDLRCAITGWRGTMPGGNRGPEAGGRSRVDRHRWCRWQDRRRRLAGAPRRDDPAADRRRLLVDHALRVAARRARQRRDLRGPRRRLRDQVCRARLRQGARAVLRRAARRRRAGLARRARRAPLLRPADLRRRPDRAATRVRREHEAVRDGRGDLLRVEGAAVPRVPGDLVGCRAGAAHPRPVRRP